MHRQAQSKKNLTAPLHREGLVSKVVHVAVRTDFVQLSVLFIKDPNAAASPIVAWEEEVTKT